VLIESDGSPWRPIVYVDDIARAFMAVLAAPHEKVGNEAFNVGPIGANYQTQRVAELVRQSVLGSKLEYAAGARPDERCYRVEFAKIGRVVPEFEPRWTPEAGIEQLQRALLDYRLELPGFGVPRFLRMKRIQHLINQDLLD
jgi:nucleoside-diphosphate-sugar epimerase